MKNLRIALVQMQALIGDIEGNLQKLASFTAKAAQEKAEIICFPELCVPGYHRERAAALAEPVPGRSTDFVARLAHTFNVIILFGLAEQGPGSKPYITHVLAFPDGRLEKYRKTHLGKSERPYFTPGHQLPVFATEKARVGVEICWDLHFPEVTTVLALKGAEVIFAPHASPSIVGDRRAIWLKYLSARAYDNSLFVAATNLVGPCGEGQEFCGGALVLDPKGNVVAEDFGGRESILVADLDAALLNTIRESQSSSMRHSFYLQFRRPELYKDLLHLSPKN